MKAHVLKGSKQEIAESIARISGKIHEAIVFEEESMPMSSGSVQNNCDDIFAEMDKYMVDVQDVDDSREAIYSRMQGE